jgi:uncharacterized protein DUF4337
MKADSNSQSAERIRSTGTAYTGQALLMILCALGMLSALLAGLHCLSLAEGAQTQATSRWVTYLSDFHLEHFYKIQKEQLELRLNELAIREDLDDLVRENYRLRIAEYANQAETVHRKGAQEENEAHAYEEQHDRNLRRTRWLMVGAAGFVLVITFLTLHVLAGGKGFMVAAMLLLVASMAVCANAFSPLWK